MYLDLRHEILDHIAKEIETIMTDKETSFENTFAMVCKTWNEELAPHSNFWIGNGYEAPKLVIKKSVQILKRVYPRVFFYGSMLAIFIYFLLKNWEIMHEFANEYLGGLYFLILTMGIFGYLKIINAKVASTYSLLYRTKIALFCFWMLLFNPLITDWYAPIKEGQVSFLPLLMHAIVLMSMLSLFLIYWKHRKYNKPNKPSLV